jgi:hypothetical protein
MGENERERASEKREGKQGAKKENSILRIPKFLFYDHVRERERNGNLRILEL